MKKKSPKLRVVSVSPAVLSTAPEPETFVEVTLRFEVEDQSQYEGCDGLGEWINGTFDNAEFSSDVGFPIGLGQPMVVKVQEK